MAHAPNARASSLAFGTDREGFQLPKYRFHLSLRVFERTGIVDDIVGVFRFLVHRHLRADTRFDLIVGKAGSLTQPPSLLVETANHHDQFLVVAISADLDHQRG